MLHNLPLKLVSLIDYIKLYLNEADKKMFFFNQRAMPKNVQLLLLLSRFSRVRLCVTP